MYPKKSVSTCSIPVHIYQGCRYSDTDLLAQIHSFAYGVRSNLLPQFFWRVIIQVASLSLCLLLFTGTDISVAGIAIEPIQPAAHTPFVPGRYRALIIGNDDYKDPSGRWSRLNTAVADANSMEALLREQYGFSDIIQLQNAGRRDMLFALRELSQRVLPNDSVLIFYAGHGYLDDTTKKGFWVPVDARGDDFTTYLHNSTIRDELSNIADRAKHTLLIADSCFSGSLLRRGSNSALPTEQTNTYFNKVAQKKSVQIITSGGDEFVDDNYRQSGHSPFTYFLMNELNLNEQPMVTLSELATNVTKAVANNVDQTPSAGVLSGAGDELGEFIFVKIKLKLEVPGYPADKIKVQVEVEQAGEPTATLTPTATTATTVLKEAPNAVAAKPANAETTPSNSTHQPPPKPAAKPIYYPMPSL